VPRRTTVLQAGENLCRYARTSLVCTSGTNPVCLVDLVYLVGLVQPNNRDRPNRRDRPDRPDRPNRPNEQVGLADLFSILLEEERNVE
jgi:hypothetical protein